MTKRVMGLALIGVLLLAWLPAAQAQDGFLPTIFKFESDVSSVTVSDLEAGTVTATLAWHVAHVTDEHWLVIEGFQLRSWVEIAGKDAGLPPVGTREITLAHPLNFGPPTFRLSVINEAGTVLDQQTLVIDYEPASTPPAVVSFTSSVASVDPAALADGSARVPVAWEVSDRPPMTNIVFEQLLVDNTARNVELPRTELWIPSSGEGVVAPVAPPEGGQVQLLLRVMDIITAEVYTEAMLTLSSGDGTAQPATTAQPPADEQATQAPPATTAPALTPSPLPPLTIGDLMVQSDCIGGPTNPLRGWVDGDPVLSPTGRYAAQVFNPTGDAKLIFTPADGSAQSIVPAPNLGIPLGPAPKWAPDGSRLAFVNFAISTPGGGTIYVVNPDGSGLTAIAEYIGYYDDLTWSSDGTQLYYTSGAVQGQGSSTQVVDYKVYAVSASGGQSQVVADGCAVAR